MSSPTPPAPAHTGWASLKLLTRYQWFVFVVCCAAWSTDCMDQQLFVLARRPAMVALVPKVGDTDSRLGEFRASMTRRNEIDKKPPPTDAQVLAAVQNADINDAGTLATSFFMIGWAIGGIAFGIAGDKIGRVRTLTLTILLYAIFTGLNALSQNVWDFYAYRVLTGLGVGGAFAAAVTLLADTVPDAARPYILGMFQASSVIGNCAAAGISIWMSWLDYQGAFAGLSVFGKGVQSWQVMLSIGVIPGVLVVLVQLFLKEPPKWLAAKAAGGLKKAGSYRELLGDPVWRKHALLGLVLALSGVIGLWGIAFFSPDLQRSVSAPVYQKEAEGLKPQWKAEAEAAGASEKEADAQATAKATKYVGWQGGLWSGVTSLLQNAGSFVGIFAFAIVTAKLGRRITFAFFFVAAGVTTAATFLLLGTIGGWADTLWMPAMMGFFQLALFGGYAIYFPELFPTRLRSTGTSFCYNVGRLLAAAGPFALGLLTSRVYFEYESPLPFRYAGVTMCSVFLIGLIALPFLPETKGKPLPE